MFASDDAPVFLPPGVIVFASDQEVRELMKAVERANVSGYFTWIGSDGWGGRTIVSNGKEKQVLLVISCCVCACGCVSICSPLLSRAIIEVDSMMIT